MRTDPFPSSLKFVWPTFGMNTHPDCRLFRRFDSEELDDLPEPYDRIFRFAWR